MAAARPSTISWVRNAGGAPEASLRPEMPLALLPPQADEPARALCHLVLGEDFVRRMLPVLERSLGAGCWQQIEESLWVGGRLCDVRGWTGSGMLAYEGFTVRRAGSLGEGLRLEEKALFVKFPRAHGWLQDDFTTALVALLELTEEVLRCDRLFICLERDEAETNSLVRSLMFAGFHLAESFGPLVGHDPYLTLQYEAIKADSQAAAINN